MTIPLLIGVLFLLLVVYRKLRVDLFRDKVFQLRRALFLIASDNPDEFFRENSPYRFFENIFNTTLSYTENFSLISTIIEVNFLLNGTKKRNIKDFSFASIKKVQLKKISSLETRRKVSAIIDSFEAHYTLFLFTRTFLGLILFCFVAFFLLVYLFVKELYKKKKEALKRADIVRSSIDFYKLGKMMNNSQFAYVASIA